jgi:osmotically-inducible protein OsmY
LIQALLDEPLLKRCLIHSRLPQVLQSHRKSLPEAQGTIVAAVSDGIVTLNGEVASLIQKWLTGVLAWWTPGCRDVVDELVNVPAQEDNDDAVTETVRLALEKDLFVNATKVQVSTKDRVVTLRGMVPNEAMMQLAERDSWYVAGVKNVVNQLAVKW